MSEMIKSHLETREGRLQGVLRKLLLLRDGKKAWGGGGGGGGGGGEAQKKKIRARENKTKKNWRTPINPRKYHAMA